MARTVSNCLRLVAAIVAGISFCLAAYPARAANEPRWLEIHSAHFTVITDGGDKKGREVALRFEQMRAVFANLLTKDRLNQSVPLTILAFGDDKAYYQAAPLGHDASGKAQPIEVPGFFVPGEDQDFIVLNLSESESWRAVASDMARMLLSYNYPPAQAWFDTGLTEYFSSIHVDNQKVEIGGDPKSLIDLLNKQPWIPLPDLFATKLTPKPNTSKSAPTMYDAECWIVMHYLLHQQKLAETGTYFGLALNQHLAVADAIQQAYGVTAAQLEQVVKDYFRAQSAAITALGSLQPITAAPPDGSYRFPVPVGADDSTITSKPLAEADATAYYAQVQIRVPERRDAGLKTLRDLASTATAVDKKIEAKAAKKKSDDDAGQLPRDSMGSGLAHRILAWDHVTHGEFDDAIPELGDAAALNQSDMWVRYYLCALKYRMAQAKHADIQGLPNMMLDLKSVLEWYPEMAGAYDLLALARNEGGSTPAAMQAERAAMTLSPRNEHYVYHLAQIYIASKKYEAADALLNRLKASDDPQIAAQAREQVERSGAERKYGIPVGGPATQSKLAPQKSPFDVLEEDAAKRAAVEKSPDASRSADKRKPKFLKGRLIDVDCSHAPTAILTVAAGSTEMKLRAADYKSLLLIGADDFSCEWHDVQVTVNYKPGGAADGDVVSLEMR
jgi:tetratricopeptide (TPR) repeat protein